MNAVQSLAQGMDMGNRPKLNKVQSRTSAGILALV
jgi:hypothetical protein